MSKKEFKIIIPPIDLTVKPESEVDGYGEWIEMPDGNRFRGVSGDASINEMKKRILKAITEENK